MKVLLLDIETSPLRAWVWSPRVDYISPDQFIDKESVILSWAARWRDQTRMKSDFLTPDEIEARDDTSTVSSLAELVREADALVAHNLNKFDLPVLNGRVARHKMEPLGPKAKIDTYQMSRSSFRFAFYKLDWLGELLPGKRKLRTDMELWTSVMDGSEPSMRKMVRYNRQDVNVLGEVLDHIEPYVERIQRLHDGPGCRNCGSHDKQQRGYYYLTVGTYPKYQCNTCKRYYRGRRAIRMADGV